MDFLPTKGIEYLMVIGYLLVLIPFWMVLQGGRRRQPAAAATRTLRRSTVVPGLRGWFRVPEGVHFHQGHTWAVPEGGGVFKVGLDDFAQRLVGPPDRLRLPEVGAALEEGERGWSLGVGDRTVDLLSPIRGEVVALNAEAIDNPALVSDDPYGSGWLMKVKAPRPDAALKNLLPWRLARAWMEDAADRLSAAMSPPLGAELGRVLQDGGIPVAGLARQIDPEHWDRLAAELLLTGER